MPSSEKQQLARTTFQFPCRLKIVLGFSLFEFLNLKISLVLSRPSLLRFVSRERMNSKNTTPVRANAINVLLQIKGEQKSHLEQIPEVRSQSVPLFPSPAASSHHQEQINHHLLVIQLLVVAVGNHNV